MYKRTHEYDLPITSPEPKVFEFVKPCDSEVENPWKESLRILASLLMLNASEQIALPFSVGKRRVGLVRVGVG